MENKKIIIPIVLGAVLLLGIVFTVVYKSTSKDPFEKPAVETLAPKETKKHKRISSLILFSSKLKKHT